MTVFDSFAQQVALLMQQASTELVLPRFRNLVEGQIDTKSGPDDLVTVADREAEEWLTPRLLGLRNGVCVGEEAVAHNPGLRDQAGHGTVWTVDPVDGTHNFVHGKDHFCMMVALLEEGIPQRTWLWHPLEQILYYAQAGSGAFRIEGDTLTRLSVANTPLQLEQLIGEGSTKFLKPPFRGEFIARLKQIENRISMRCAGVLAMKLAAGDIHFIMHGNCTPWDHAPVDLLCREAGAYAGMSVDGRPFNAAYNEAFMVASSKVMWDQLNRDIWRGE
ncbi:inositol monophosphatase [Alphaproteobacteria bacterium]|nr:inositol monophosphatase [Alphaproteobacteria bacterium]